MTTHVTDPRLLPSGPSAYRTVDGSHVFTEADGRWFWTDNTGREPQSAGEPGGYDSLGDAVRAAIGDLR